MAAAIALLLCAALLPAWTTAATTVKINPSTSFGEWHGWGCSLAWWAQALGNRSDLAAALFTKKTTTIRGTTVPGLGFNFVRYNPGACSWNTIADGKHMVQSPNIGRSRQMNSFWLDPSSSDPASTAWNWSVDANQVNMLQLAKSLGVDTFQLFSDSPVWWMCSNLNPSGSPSGRTDNLNAQYSQPFVVYLATVAQHAKEQWGITFDSVEAFNEPSSAWWTATGTQEGCHFDVATQSTIVPLLRRELDARGLQTMKIAASDETSFSLALSTWQHMAPAAKALVDFVDVHGYEYQSGPRAQLYEAVRASGKVLLHTEYGEGDASGVTMATNLHLDLHDLHPSLWTYWQPFDGGGWGLVASDIDGKREQSVNVKYFVLAHYTRHLAKGCTMIDTSDITTVSAYCSSTHTLVLVVFNAESQSRTFDLDLSAFATAAGPVTRWETNMHGGSMYQQFSDTSVASKLVTLAVKPTTVQTLEVAGVSL